MWQTCVKVFKSIAKYGAIAFTGYEVGNSLDSNKVQVQKETTIITKEGENLSIQSVTLLIIIMVFIGILCATIKQVFKCVVNYSKNNNSTSVNNNVEAQVMPQAVRRTTQQ